MLKQGETFVPGQEPTLAPGVRGYTLDVDGALWVPLIYAEDEGSGQVGDYLDSLPFNRTVVVPNILSGRLAGMLQRRGFSPSVAEYEEGSIDAMIRPALHLTSTPGFVSASLRRGPSRPSVAEANELEPGVWWVCRVLVNHERGKGVGKTLVAAMKLACEEQGAKVVQVAPGGYDGDTARQRGFYKACGFEATEDDPEGMMYWRPNEGEGS